MSELDASDRFAAVARSLQEQPSEAATTDMIVQLAVRLVPGCDDAGISLVQKGRRIVTVAATSDAVRAGDSRQYEVDQGPCLDTIRDEAMVTSPRLADEDRWPDWTPWVHEQFGINAMLCVQLFTSQHVYGGINLYSHTPDAFSPLAEEIALALAAHAAVAVASSREINQLQNALHSRTIIGQAEGILMERYDLTADQAFQVLVRVSQEENRKLGQIAEQVTARGRLAREVHVAAKQAPDLPS